MKNPPTIAELKAEAREAWFEDREEDVLVALTQIEQHNASACQTSEEVQSCIRVAEKQLESMYRHSAQGGPYTKLVALEVQQMKIRLECLYKELPRFSSSAKNLNEAVRQEPVKAKREAQSGERMPLKAFLKELIRNGTTDRSELCKKISHQPIFDNDPWIAEWRDRGFDNLTWPDVPNHEQPRGAFSSMISKLSADIKPTNK